MPAATQHQESIKALFVGPFALETQVQQGARYWRSRLQDEYKISVAMTIAAPPYTTDDLECRGYWVKPVGKDYKSTVKSLKKQLCGSLVWLLNEIQQLSLIHI